MVPSRRKRTSWTTLHLAQMARRQSAGQRFNVCLHRQPRSQRPWSSLGYARPDGSFGPFHLYSMRQAIEERFILDVLESYTTCRAYWRLFKKIENDPSYDKSKAVYLLKSFVDLHPHAIEEKVRIMVEHFIAKSQSEIGGRAKAMIVTRSRLHAVRYKLAVDRHLEELGHPFKALVAFSGHGGGRRAVLHRGIDERPARKFRLPGLSSPLSTAC